MTANVLDLLPQAAVAEIRMVRITVRCLVCGHDWTVTLFPKDLKEPWVPGNESRCRACGGKP